MPCDSDYLDADDQEVEYSKVLSLLEELKTNKLPKYYGDGFCPKVYNVTNKIDIDKSVKKLCGQLKKIKDIKKYSLEMQIWWRDHQRADKERIGKNKEREIEFDLILEQIIKSFQQIHYVNGDISDLGNEIGFAIGTALPMITEEEIKDFTSGIKHGISLTNGTH